MSDGITRALTLVEEGLEQHSLTDQCRCDSCIRHYGPEGSPGRCRWCYDAQQGQGCDDARRYAAIRDALNSPLSVMTGNTCEPGCVRSSLHQGDCVTEPDPLDENDHRDRLDKDGYIVRRKGPERWAWPEQLAFNEAAGWSLSDINATDGPLTFAPDADPLDENDHRDRIDRDGDRWTHRNQGAMQWCVESCNCFGVWDVSDIDRNFGPLRFADEEEL